jgi:hypothetical protein
LKVVATGALAVLATAVEDGLKRHRGDEFLTELAEHEHQDRIAGAVAPHG